MSTTTTIPHSRSSIDLGVSNNNNKSIARNHPPRLQHSPSLPNIRFPPHSAVNVVRGPLHRPSTPPSMIANETKVPSPNKLEHRESPSFDDISAFLSQSQPFKSRRHRLDRDYGHSLLTPPLTPSSSLRTAVSVESISKNDQESEFAKDPRGDSTRFLLLSNLSKRVPQDTLRASIVGSLTSTPSTPSGGSINSSAPTSIPRLVPFGNESIKGLFLRRQKSEGIAVLAFFDIRQAEIAKDIISIPSAGPLSDCIGDGISDDGTTAWIKCRFITANELVQTIGNSPFLESTDGSFYLTIETKELEVVDDRSQEDRDHSDQNLTTITADESDQATLIGDGDFNITMLKDLLKSFGGVRTFSLIDETFNAQQFAVKKFHVEYYDIREADAAYTTIDGRVEFGMKLAVTGRKPLRNKSDLPVQRDHSVKTLTDTFKNTTSNSQNDPQLPIAPPGHYSLTRERFLYVKDAETRPRHTGHEVYVNPLSGSPAPSPTYFYTSNPVEGDGTTAQPHDIQNRLPTNILYDSPGGPTTSLRSVIEGRTDADRPQNINFEGGYDIPGTGIVPWQDQTPSAYGTGFYGSHTGCYYCPSHSGSASYSTPSPFYYRADQHPQLPPSVTFPPFVNPPHPFPYEYSTLQSTPVGPTMNINMANWFEHGMVIAPGPGNGDHWFSDVQGVVPSALLSTPYCPPQIPISVSQNVAYSVHPNKNQASLKSERSTSPHYLESNANSLHTSRTSRGLTSRGSRAPPVLPERNQLNISKIEAGQDTRTTVMIKNIPNKMSDKDLVVYIGKVCPRKFDFLYLRVDFTNGCNVGYAFVNFITVQDLLFFAKKKLGEKWNMFSSEKVLQMSYADYQGKEALVEKFKNSPIMDECEAWRPRIYYSDPGPEQGLPEPFPSPTHLRRKERGSVNRGALYVPGVGRNPAAPQTTRRRYIQDEQHPQADQQGQNGEQVSGLYSRIGTSRRTDGKL